MAWGGDWELSDQSTGVGSVAFFYFVTAAELAYFHNFRRHLLTNPVRYIYILVSSFLTIFKMAAPTGIKLLVIIM